jgi:hypothetical protein
MKDGYVYVDTNFYVYNDSEISNFNISPMVNILENKVPRNSEVEGFQRQCGVHFLSRNPEFVTGSDVLIKNNFKTSNSQTPSLTHIREYE